MSIQPEILLHRVIVNGLRYFRQEPKMIDSLFKNLTQQDLQNFKNFLLKSSIDISFNFPRSEAPKVPSIVLQLTAESEYQAYLNDYLGVGNSVPMVPDQDMVVDTLNAHGASISGMSNLPEKLVGNIQVSHSVTDPVSGFGRVFWEGDQFAAIKSGIEGKAGDGIDLYVTKGQGVGQKLQVNKLTKFYLDTQQVFDPQLDSSSFIDLRRPNNPLATVGEPSRIFDEDDIYLQSKGVTYEATYKISVVAGAQQEVLHLYTLLKAIFISQRSFLEAQGLMNLAVAGADFIPKNDLTPNIVYERAMNVKFQYTFALIETLPQISRIDFTVRTCALGDESIGFSIDLEE